jgi:uncharacterized protein (TIRG00374 family)
MSSQPKSTTRLIIKLAVSVVMLALALSFVQLEDLKKALLDVPLSLAIVVVLAYTLGQVVSSFKWWLIARAGGIQVSWLHALRAYFIGMYANCFGLGVVGGDVLRAVLLAGKDSAKTPAMASVVADRAHGLGVLVLLGLTFSIFDGRNLLSPNMRWVLVLILIAAAIGWLLGPKLALKVIPKDTFLYRKVEQATQAFPKSPTVVVWITLISAAFHMFHVWLHWLMAQGLGLDISMLVLLGSVPFVNVLTSLPISWQGLGVRESAYIFFLSSAGLSETNAIVFGAIWLLAVTLSSAFGGIVAFLSKTNTTSSQMQTTPPVSS